MKKHSVQWSPSAKNELRAIVAYIKKEQPQNAKKIFLHIQQSAQKLEHFPNRGRIIPELRSYGILFYREIIIKPWRLIYRVLEKESKVWVVSIIDGRRDVEEILFQRFLSSTSQ